MPRSVKNLNPLYRNDGNLKKEKGTEIEMKGTTTTTTTTKKKEYVNTSEYSETLSGHEPIESFCCLLSGQCNKASGPTNPQTPFISGNSAPLLAVFFSRPVRRAPFSNDASLVTGSSISVLYFQRVVEVGCKTTGDFHP